MKLKTDADIGPFFRSVQNCTYEVFFDTEEGDHLNLKSSLSQFVFAAVAGKLDELSYEIIVAEADRELLLPYLTEEGRKQ